MALLPPTMYIQAGQTPQAPLFVLGLAKQSARSVRHASFAFCALTKRGSPQGQVVGHSEFQRAGSELVATYHGHLQSGDCIDHLRSCSVCLAGMARDFAIWVQVLFDVSYVLSLSRSRIRGADPQPNRLGGVAPFARIRPVPRVGEPSLRARRRANPPHERQDPMPSEPVRNHSRWLQGHDATPSNGLATLPPRSPQLAHGVPLFLAPFLPDQLTWFEVDVSSVI